MNEQILKLDDVIVENDLNPRQGALDQDVVLDYSAHVDELPPMTAYDVQGFYFLVGGFHRYAAHRLAQRSEGRFVVRVGTREEAKEFADLDNLKHGLRLNRAERRQVIERQLKRHPDWSDSRLATACLTTDKTVRMVREQLEQTSEIPRLDILTGADGIARPRTIAPRREAEAPADLLQVTFENVAGLGQVASVIVEPGGNLAAGLAAVMSAPAVAPELLRPVEELKDDTPAWLRDDDAREDAAPLDPNAAMDRLAADLAAYQPNYPAGFPEEYPAEVGETEMMAGAENETNQAEAPTVAANGSQPEIELSSSAPALPVPPPPVPAPAPTPPPPPVIRAAPWVASISVPDSVEAPALLTLLHGSAPKSLLPESVARRMIAAIEARIEPAAAVLGVPDGVPVMAPDWLIPRSR